ncbi:unnamed protein product [Ilex paraguariensis]|uniref:Uncharacterized protein n=1 Tax=Ilex paraguariensis TaxID=185542 RepID=A0ABC8T6W6_9AQUA
MEAASASCKETNGPVNPLWDRWFEGQEDSSGSFIFQLCELKIIEDSLIHEWIMSAAGEFSHVPLRSTPTGCRALCFSFGILFVSTTGTTIPEKVPTEELEQLEKMEAASASCKETNGPVNPLWDRWFEGQEDSSGCGCWLL